MHVGADIHIDRDTSIEARHLDTGTTVVWLGLPAQASIFCTDTAAIIKLRDVLNDALLEPPTIPEGFEPDSLDGHSRIDEHHCSCGKVFGDGEALSRHLYIDVMRGL